MKEWLNRAEITLSHGNMNAKLQFTFWSVLSKIFFGVFIYSYTVSHNWQMQYFRALLKEYHTRPTIAKLELNCDFVGYDKPEAMELVQFYFAGTRGFRLNLDGSYEYLSELTEAAGDMGVDVNQIGPFLVDGWQEEDGELGSICMHF